MVLPLGILAYGTQMIKWVIWSAYKFSLYIFGCIAARRGQKKLNKNTKLFIFKLDGVGPVDSRPSTD